MEKSAFLSNLAYYLFEKLSKTVCSSSKSLLTTESYRPNIPIQYMPSAENLHTWLLSKLGQIENIQIFDHETENALPIIRLYKGGIPTDLIFLENFEISYDIPLFGLLTQLQSENVKAGRNKPVYMNLVEPFISQFHDQTPGTRSVDVFFTAFDILSEGLTKYADFGMSVLCDLCTNNSIIFSLYQEKIIAVDMDLYEIHPETLHAERLFQTTKIGENGLDVLYDGIFLLKIRLKDDTSQSVNPVVNVSVERENGQAFTF